jgi:hypothetical protein
LVCLGFCFVLFCFYSAGDKTQGHVHVSHALLPLSYIPSPSIGYLWERVSLDAWTILNCNPLVVIPHIAGMTGMHHCVLVIGWDGVSRTLPGLASEYDPPSLNLQCS